MNGETWAMRMIAESVGMAEADMPQAVAACRLDAGDAALAAQDKKARAVDYIFGAEYSLAKSVIRANVNGFRSEIASRFSTQALDALDGAKKNLFHSKVLLQGVLLVMFGALVGYLTLVVIPITRYSRELLNPKSGDGALLREGGAKELKLLARALNELNAREKHNTERLRRLGYIDYLTDVPNRASITEYVENAIRSGKESLGVMIVDVDNFKCYNDAYGHTTGDATLVCIAKAVCSAQNAQDGIAGRLCGEEFIVAMKAATVESLADTAQRILENVRGITAVDVSLPAQMGFGVTVSIGGAIWPGGEPTSFTKLLAEADRAMYISKTTGKDRFTMSSVNHG